MRRSEPQRLRRAHFQIATKTRLSGLLPGIAVSASRLIHDRPDCSQFGTAASGSDLQHIYIVIKFEAVRSQSIPRPSDASWWGV
jgi:hypothetical protein